MNAGRFLNSAQVAAAIGYDNARDFLLHRARLEDETLFPLPMPTHTRRSLRWRADQIAVWVERHGTPKAPPGAPNLYLLNLAKTA